MQLGTGTRRRAQGAVALLVIAGLAAGCERTPLQPLAQAEGQAALVAPGGGYRYTTVDVPGATATYVFRMNARGDLVGGFTDATGVHGFVDRAGAYDTLDFPNATATYARGINERGTIVGHYTLAGMAHGFVLDGGEFTTVDVPGKNQTRLWDIAANGMISGDYQPAPGGRFRAFVRRGDEFELLAIPDAAMSAGYGINLRGEVVGHYTLLDATQPGGVTKMFGFVWRDGEVMQLDHPTPNGMSCSQGIGDQGVVVGHYYELSSDIVYGYVWQDGEFIATLRVPGARETYPTSITSSGVIAGYYFDVSGAQHGFVAEPLNATGR